ncbi:MAG: NAD(P)H-hydrate dehydratase [Deltaproteobacteria bacterium]|jgi:NAD(P)H-hydrate epimerase|nr:NAD(P)H-hydrate dehydratase [Deltaproteobacteria bacterium]
MYVTTSSESRALDKVAIKDFGLPGIVLMENAARSILRVALEFWPDLGKASHKILILAGPGQNGGDGFALARLLAALGHSVDTCLVRNPGREPAGDAAINYAVLKKLNLPLQIIESHDDPLPDFSKYGLIVDAVFGTGLDRPLTGQTARVLSQASRLPAPRPFRVLAVDLPSGLRGDTGEAEPEVLAADLTVSLGTLKIGLFLNSGPEVSGQVRLGDIGLCPPMFEAAKPGAMALDACYAKSLVPARPFSGHKGTFGHAVLCGGATGKTGALVLAALGAQRSGCGLITAAHPASLSTVFEAKLTSAMTLPLPEFLPGEISSRASVVLRDFLQTRKVRAAALGPGLGLGKEAKELVFDLAVNLSETLVLDADALTHLAGRAEVLADSAGHRILTPHPGEAGRLLGVGSDEIEADRPGAARELAKITLSTVILKGRHTLVSNLDGFLLVNLSGGPILATGGSGDLLTGLVTGLLAQGLDPFDAAALGVYLHGLAGDLAASKLIDRGIFPSEIQACLPEAWKTLIDQPTG